ncbi:MAG TPA: cob(I)yrinic acid a,c-diamide adenosyltransferase [Smithellaceae bacterium]|jgi:cob(I)alamin adenosyltransferase|nr:cob(I)yrinic acid a,c-diamide adenosyltransferase [Smithellaceae bacterium]
MTISKKKPAVKKTPSARRQNPTKTAPTNRGLVIVITGNGKGKTTSAFGQALRAVGQGYKVFIMQFMKGRDYGEFLAAEKYLPRLTLRRSGLDSFVMRGNPAPIDIELARTGFAEVQKAVSSGKYDMVILDEINVAVDFNLIPLQDVLDLIANRPASVDLILTGRYAPKELIKLADTVSEVKEIKHHYAAGIKDRAGIEY